MVPTYINYLWQLSMFAGGLVAAWAIVKGLEDE